jgi:hypothetical protein
MLLPSHPAWPQDYYYLLYFFFAAARWCSLRLDRVVVSVMIVGQKNWQYFYGSCSAAVPRFWAAPLRRMKFSDLDYVLRDAYWNGCRSFWSQKDIFRMHASS